MRHKAFINTRYLHLPFPRSKYSRYGIADAEHDGALSRVVSCRITNPDKAAQWIPFAKHLQKGTVITATSCHPAGSEGLLAVHISQADQFKSFPAQVCMLAAAREFLFLPVTINLPVRFAVDCIALRHYCDPDPIVPWWRSTREELYRYTRPPTPVFVVTDHRNHGLYPEILVPPGHRIPKGACPLPAYRPGYSFDSDVRFYRTASLFPNTSCENLAAVAAEAAAGRTAEIVAMCPHKRPSRLDRVPAALLAEMVEYNRLVGEGWASVADILRALGIKRTRSTEEALAIATPPRSFNLPGLATDLYRLVSVDKIAEDGRFTAFLQTLCPDLAPFLSRCILSDRVRAALLAETMAEA